MSRARKKWWGYVRRCIREYRPLREDEDAALTEQERQKYNALRLALRGTACLPDGDTRLAFFRRYYWGSCTLIGAAMRTHISQRTAERWHASFVRLVAANMDIDP